MDQTQLQEKIALYYQKLPQETKVLFAGMSWLETLKEIDVKYGLNDEQIKTLGTETTILLLGIISLEDYVKTIKTEIALNGDTTDKMLDEIGQKIIKDVEPLLYQAYSSNAKELMEEKYGKRFDERLSSLPEKVKEAVNDSHYQAFIYEVGNKYSLSIDQIGLLEEITLKVMTGMVKPDQYENEIKNKITIPGEKSKELVSEINENVFKNIKGILMENWDKEESLPIPPYIAKEDDEVPLPPPAYNAEIKEKTAEKELTTEIKNEGMISDDDYMGKESIDLDMDTLDKSDDFKKHGIEILSDYGIEENIKIPTPPIKKEEVVTKPEIVIPKPEITQAIPLQTATPTTSKIEYREEIPEKEKSIPTPSIISNKLFNKTVGETIVSDYSLPTTNNQNTFKALGETQAKPHDPYHEAI